MLQMAGHAAESFMDTNGRAIVSRIDLSRGQRFLHCCAARRLDAADGS